MENWKNYVKRGKKRIFNYILILFFFFLFSNLLILKNYLQNISKIIAFLFKARKKKDISFNWISSSFYSPLSFINF